MKIWLNAGRWKRYEGGDLSAELASRGITIGPQAVIGEWAVIGEGAGIRTGAVIGDSARIGDWARIGERARIGRGVCIGPWTRVGEGVRIGERARIGTGVWIGEGARIGDWARIGKKNLILMGPLGSDQAVMTAYIHQGAVMIGSRDLVLSADDFLLEVAAKHGDNRHGRAYQAAVGYAVSALFAKRETISEKKLKS